MPNLLLSVRHLAPRFVFGQSRQAATDISKLCGVDYAMQDPDLNIQLEMRRNCAGGIDGGEGD